MYSKHLISVTALLLSTAACSSNPPDEGTGGTSGTGASGGSGATGGTHPSSGGAGGTGGSTGGTGGSTGGTGGTTGGTGGSTGGTGGSTGGTGGTTGGTGGSTGGAGGSTGGTGGSTGGAGGSTGGTGGSVAGGGGTTGGTGGSAGGMGGSGGRGGSSGMGAGGTAGMAMGGSGGGTAAVCDNLKLAPSKTGVAKPSGSAGGLKVIDWAGFTGAVSYTFDDNTPSQLPNYNALKGTGGHFTWFVVGSWLNGSASNISGYKATLADGQEIASHTYSHQSAGSQSDLQQNETFITQNFGVTANSMAAPNCDGSWASVAPNILFQNRGPCSNSAATVAPRDSTSPFQLPAYLPAPGASADTLTGTYQTGKWRIFVIHGFDSQNGTYQPVPIGNVTAAMSTAVSGGYWVEGITNVGAYWQGQKLIPTSATTSATWTLPAHFPKNMCVRITTSGGTVSQKGQTIPWDDHGYYQISLDAGEVSIQ